MSERVLRWGLLSTARINRAVIPPLRDSARHELVAVASRSMGQAENYAREWDIPRAFGSYEALLADPDIDVIYNPLPNSLHAEWTIKATQAGKHVLCEKPLATRLEEVDAMMAAAAQAGVVVAEAFMYRHHPQTLKVKEMVDGGEIGRMAYLRGSFSFMLDRPQDVRLDAALGGGSIWDVGCYPISYTRLLAGEPEEVFGWQNTSASGVDETFVGQMRFANGVLAQFDSSFRTPFRTYMEIVGTEGTLRVPMPFGPQLNPVVELVRGDEVVAVPMPGQELYLGEVEDMADAILLGHPQRMSLQDSRNNVAAILALLDSARQGRPVRLPQA